MHSFPFRHPQKSWHPTLLTPKKFDPPTFLYQHIQGLVPNVTDITEIPCAFQYEIKSCKVKFPMLPILLKFQVLLNLKIKYVKFNVTNVTDITDIPYTS